MRKFARLPLTRNVSILDVNVLSATNDKTLVSDVTLHVVHFSGFLTLPVDCKLRVYRSCLDKRGHAYNLTCDGQSDRIVDINYRSGDGSCRKPSKSLWY